MVFAMRWCTLSSCRCSGSKFNESDACGNLGCHKWSLRCACVYALQVDEWAASLKTQTIVAIWVSQMVFGAFLDACQT